MRMNRFGLILAVLLVLLLPMVLSDDNALKSNELYVRYDYYLCRINFVNSQAQILQGVGEISTQNLINDSNNLKNYVNLKDAKNFNLIVLLLKEDISKINEELNKAKENFYITNDSNINKNKIRKSWEKAIKTFNSCNSEKQKNLLSIRGSTLHNNINKWDKIINNMSLEGYDTSSLKKITNNAKEMLNNISNNSKTLNDTKLKETLDDLNDKELKSYVQFEINKIIIYSQRHYSIARKAGLDKELDEVYVELGKTGSIAASDIKYPHGVFNKSLEELKDIQERYENLIDNLTQNKIKENNEKIRINNTDNSSDINAIRYPKNIKNNSELNALTAISYGGI